MDLSAVAAFGESSLDDAKRIYHKFSATFLHIKNASLTVDTNLKVRAHH